MYITFANQDDDIWWNNLPLPSAAFGFAKDSTGGYRDKNHSSSLYGMRSGYLCSSGASRSAGLNRYSALARCDNLTNSAPYCHSGTIYHSAGFESDLPKTPWEVPSVKITLAGHGTLWFAVRLWLPSPSWCWILYRAVSEDI